MKKAGTRFFSALGLILFLGGCLEELGNLDKIQDYTWNPEVAIPISNSTFGLVDFLENDEVDDFIETDENGLIILTYQEEFESQDAASYIEIPDETYEESFSFGAPILIQLPIQLEISATESYEFELESEDGDKIDSARLNSGRVALNLVANFPASGEVSFVFHSALEDGIPIERTYSWTYTGQQPVLNVNNTIDLSDFKLDLTNGGTTSNSFNFDMFVTLNYDGQPVLPSNSLDLEIQLIDAGFHSIYGEFGTRELVSDPESISLDFFDNLFEGSFRLDEPSISVELTNSYGIPLGIDFGSLTFSNSEETQQLTGSIADNLQIIDAPDIDQVGESVVSTISINSANSNLPDLISLLPNEITYEIGGSINPGGINEKVFVLGESTLDAKLDIELPLIGRMSDLKVEQEFEFDGPEILDNFNYALVKLTVENGFPLGTQIQVYFQDQFGQTLDVLIEGDDTIFEAAPVDAEGIVNSTNTKVTEIELNKSKIDAIRNTQSLLLVATFATTDDGNVSVQMLDSYEMDVKMGIQTEFNITLDL